MRADLRRLTGRPVLDVFADERARVRAVDAQLPSAVYVEQKGVVRGSVAERAFEVDEKTNKPFPLMNRCRRFFEEKEEAPHPESATLRSCWNSAVVWRPKKEDKVWVCGEDSNVYSPGSLHNINTEDNTFDVLFKIEGQPEPETNNVPRGRIRDTPPKSVLLVHGVAGSGKSVVSHKMYTYLCGEFFDERQTEGITVVPIYCNLPAIANPLTDLVRGALRAAPYNLRDTQIEELRELAHDGASTIEVVFILDGYDLGWPKHSFQLQKPCIDKSTPWVIDSPHTFMWHIATVAFLHASHPDLSSLEV